MKQHLPHQYEQRDRHERKLRDRDLLVTHHLLEAGNQVAVKGFPPATLAAVAAAIQQPDWVNDSWGNPLQYTVNGKQFKLWSCGPDGVSGTSDDIAYKRN